MKFKVQSYSNAELEDRRRQLTEDLVSSEYAAIEGAPLTLRDIRDLASLGLLSEAERKIYDELRRVELLLGE
ncbi:hypothetical protein QP027_11130 [Corynebacterium breve]|uniref:Uncharacterized protein n=1 Tax=Corynebacterium breve TaxID=3049799 RepID=A0ABY8VD86_9CORY|nr:hypothetical protein [Corynebacterium breve]WIM67621.1 hypothetical protein QP027_11130 [Corynebacterium breve]